MSDRPVLWRPSPERMERSEMTRYMRWLEQERGVKVADYESLWRWSVDELEEFWASIWDYFDVRASTRYERVLGRREMPGAEWFRGARLSYAEHIFRDRDEKALAIVATNERGDVEEWTWGRLKQETARIAAGLRDLGVERGDRVAAFMPNIPETAAAFFATASIGAIWSSCSPDFGARGVLDRFAQIEPKVLLAVDGYLYQGKEHDRTDIVRTLAAEMPSIEHVVVLGRLTRDVSGGVSGGEAEGVGRGVSGGEAGGAGRGVSGGEAGGVGRGVSGVPGAVSWERLRGRWSELTFEQVPFDHPLWVLYSSGTTGLPKAIVQGQGGILLEHLKALVLQVDSGPEDRIFWFTTTGWMMWNFLMGALLGPAAVVLYDGSPGYPDMGALWDLAERTGITCFGTSASYIATCMKQGLKPAEGRDLSALRSVGSTGSTLAPEGFDWIYEQLGEEVWLFSTSGGTDVCTAFVGGCVLLPVRRGELQCRALGAKVEAFDEDGKSVVEQLGELVITEPMPSMPTCFWNDEDGTRYRDSYFGVYEGVWRHGDWLEITNEGGAILHGRSDATINRGGVRMGSSEIYRSVLSVPAVTDALVVDVEGWMPLFVTLAEDAALDDALKDEIKRRVREDCSPRHVPNEIFTLKSIPRTRTGKVMEVPVKRILTGMPAEKAASRDSLAEPDSLDPIVALASERALARPES